MISQAARILIGLAAGLLLGAVGAWAGWPLDASLAVTGVVGGLWLDALRMTVIPLVFSLLVTGIASAAANAKAGGVTRRALSLFALLLLFSALLGALLGPVLLGAWSPPAGALAALRAGLELGETPQIPSVTDWFRGLVPTNVVSAAAEGSIVPLTIFALSFGFAATRLTPEKAAPLLAFFDSVADTMLVIVRFVLLLAPIGVFALAFSVGARLGIGAGAALAHYVVVQIAVTLILAFSMYPLVVLAGRLRLGAFARAVAPAQAVAASTQSSLASLPPMLAGAERLNLERDVPPVVLPLAVGLFRIAAPASIVIVMLAMARMSGVEVGPTQIAIAALLATINTLVIVGLPNQVTFFAAYAPPALAVGVPIELLPLLLAVDTIPDIFYTVSNVTADLAVTSVVGRNATKNETPGGAPSDQISRA
ncbi:MAG: dicarboxylate/amino acid:cation symporter [Proteobacteria bacterium]|nr:dicarboxylate/amino acid:cation symporter [Pseudomonadota bacterium]